MNIFFKNIISFFTRTLDEEQTQLMFAKGNKHSLLDTLRNLSGFIDLKDIYKIEIIFSSPLNTKIADIIKTELKVDSFAFYNDDLVAIFYVELKNSIKYLFLKKYDINYNVQYAFKEVDDYPSLTVYKIIQYKDGYYYPSNDKITDKTPLKVDLDKLEIIENIR